MRKYALLFAACLMFVAPYNAYSTPVSISELPSTIVGGEYVLQVGNGEALTLSGSSSISGSAWVKIINYGTIVFDDFSLFTSGADTSVTNYGSIIGDNWHITDQYDATSIVNHGSISLDSIMLTANGAQGRIDYETFGSSVFGSFNADANYGGLINISLSEGGFIRTSSLTLDASGYSHGQESQIYVLGGEIETAPVPEPATLILFGSGIFAIFGLRRKVT
jgi:hypothetical protein